MKDADLHLSAGIGTLVATAAMVVIGLKSGDCNARAASKPEADPFADMKVIDAALAEVSKAPAVIRVRATGAMALTVTP